LCASEDWTGVEGGRKTNMTKQRREGEEEEGGREGTNTPYLLVLVRHLPPHLPELGEEILVLCVFVLGVRRREEV